MHLCVVFFYQERMCPSQIIVFQVALAVVQTDLLHKKEINSNGQSCRCSKNSLS